MNDTPANYGSLTDNSRHNASNDEIDLREICKKLWANRLLIFLITTTFFVSSTIIAWRTPNTYRATAVLAPATEENNLSARISAQLGGLASLAGFRGKNALSEKGVLGIEILKSNAFINRFIKDHGLTIPLMASIGWDSEKNTWIIDKNIYDKKNKLWRNRGEAANSPSEGKIHRAFSSILSVEEDNRTGIISIGIESYSPSAAMNWTNWLVSDLNNHIRDRDIKEAKEAIKFLEHQLSQTATTDLHQVFYQLIEDQTQTMMLAEAREEYVFKVIDPAILPDEKFRPKRMLIVIGSTFGGAIFSILISLLLSVIRKPIK